MAYSEITNRRTVNAKHWRDPATGQNQFDCIPGTVLHYGDDLENTVDMRPQSVNNAQLNGWVINQNGWHYALGIPGDHPGQDGWVGFGGKQGQHWFKFRLVSFGYMHIAANGTKTFTPLAGNPSYNRANLGQAQAQTIAMGPENETIHVASTAIWSDVLNGIDVSWQAEGRGLKELVTLKSSKRATLPAPLTTLAETYVCPVFEIDTTDIPRFTKNGVLQSGDFDDIGGRLECRNALNELLTFMPLDNAYMKDDPDIKVPVTKRLYTDPGNGKRYLLTGIPWASYAALPEGDLIFDPTFDVQPDETAANDTYISAGNATTNYDSDFNLKTGQGNAGEYFRTLLKFDCSSIPAGVTVSSATLKLVYSYADNPSSRAHSAYSVLRAWVEDQATWNVYSTGNNWGTAGCDNTTSDRSGTAMGTWNQPGSFPTAIDISLDTTTVAAWCGTTNNGMLLRMDNESTTSTKSEYGNARDGTASNRPRIVIVYVESALEQEGYRWRNDDGSETTATWRQSQDTADTVEIGETVRLRVLIDAVGNPDSAAYELQYRKVGDTDWHKVV